MALFGPGQYLRGESAVYAAMDKASPDYHGGLWDYVKTPRGNRYMRPKMALAETGYRLIQPQNFSDVRVSADGAGIAITLLVLNHLAWQLCSTKREGAARLVQANYEALMEELIDSGHRDLLEIRAFLD